MNGDDKTSWIGALRPERLSAPDAPRIALIAVTLTFYMNRYRASTEAVLCLLAAVAVDALLSRRELRR